MGSHSEPIPLEPPHSLLSQSSANDRSFQPAQARTSVCNARAATSANGQPSLPGSTAAGAEDGASMRRSERAQAAPVLDIAKNPRRLKAEFRRRVLHFAPSWFSVNMGTGIASILLHELPYQFNGLHLISTLVFFLNVFLFFSFFFVSIARYVRWPKVWWAMLFHPQQSFFLGTFAMGFATIVNMVALTGVPAFGRGMATLAWVLWWIDAVASVTMSIGLPFVLFTRHVQTMDKITGVWFLPIAAPIVCSASGAIVASVLPPSEARLTIVVSYIMWGLGVPLCFLLMGLYFLRLSIYKIPPATLIVSVFIPLGPCGQGGFGLLRLSSVLRSLAQADGVFLGGGSLYTPEEANTMASAVYGASIIVALIMWGLGLFWFVIAVAVICDLAACQKIAFNMGWWGFTFPIGVYASSTTALAAELDSVALRVIGTILSLSVVLLWLIVAGKTAVAAWNGSIFVAPCLGENGEPPSEIPGRQYL